MAAAQYRYANGELHIAENSDQLPSDVAEALTAIPGAIERARTGLRQVGEGNTSPLDELST